MRWGTFEQIRWGTFVHLAGSRRACVAVTNVEYAKFVVVSS